MCKWVPANLIRELTLRWTSFPYRWGVEILLVDLWYKARYTLRLYGRLSLTQTKPYRAIIGIACGEQTLFSAFVSRAEKRAPFSAGETKTEKIVCSPQAIIGGQNAKRNKGWDVHLGQRIKRVAKSTAAVERCKYSKSVWQAYLKWGGTCMVTSTFVP